MVLSLVPDQCSVTAAADASGSGSQLGMYKLMVQAATGKKSPVLQKRGILTQVNNVTAAANCWSLEAGAVLCPEFLRFTD